MGHPSGYANLSHALPEGYLEWMVAIGSVIGVPIAALPIYLEQQFNVFEMLRKLGLGVKVKMDYRRDAAGEQDVTIVSSK
ncbi:hypothetical protein CDL15_Pgr016361 [Punica granatum]|uniref:Uncharacterized protein n=1 Tax=Punica granatum TaxID=22663 RepID=A0A218W7H5_PUNGR|nr:hypothetical protein CDL15_Pgr016361 [Punica granatum]